MRLSLRGLLGLQKKDIQRLRTELREKDNESRKAVEDFLIDHSKRSELSYIVVAGSSKILTYTPTFGEKFYFDDEIKGANCYKLLANPKDEFTYEDLKNTFRTPERIELTAVIIDGKKADRFVHLEKEEPIRIGHYFYTTIHIYEIGSVEENKGSIERKLGVKGPEVDLYDLVAQRKIKKIRKEADIQVRKQAKDTKKKKKK